VIFSLFADSKVAIQAITSNQTPENETILECRKLLKYLNNQNKLIVFQWIPSHIGIVGNEIADGLAKKGTKIQITTHPNSNHHRKIEEINKAFQMENLKEKLQQPEGNHGKKL
ncbi:hypothetical protein L9F63_025100, partial [Diploptera punctata]